MFKLIFSILLILKFSSVILFAQNSNNFEGIIKLVETSNTDTITFVFMFKNNKVRINELNTKNQIDKFAIININTSEVYYFKPDKKIYTKISSYRLNKTLDTNIIILKTGNYKYILNEKCYQWRLKIPNLNTEINYWVTTKKYPQFYTAMLMLNSRELKGKYFVEIEGSENVFPMLAVERSLLRKWKSQQKVTEIKETPIDNQQFEIPKNYSNLKK